MEPTFLLGTFLSSLLTHDCSLRIRIFTVPQIFHLKLYFGVAEYFQLVKLISHVYFTYWIVPYSLQIYFDNKIYMDPHRIN